MSLIAIDGFDHYAGSDTTDFAMKWDGYRIGGGALIGTTNPRRPDGRHVVLNGHVSLYGYITKEFGSNLVTSVNGFAFRAAALTDHKGFIFWDGINPQCSVYIESDGSIAVYRHYKVGAEVLLEQSDPGLVVVDQWYYIEMKFLINNSTGTYQVDLNGDTILSGSGVDTQHTANAYATKVTTYGFAGATPGDLYIDDYYIDDSTIHGTPRIDTLWPDANGSTNAWDPNPTNLDNFEAVDDDNDIDEDTSYVVTALSNQNDSYNVDTLAALYSPGTADEAEIFGIGITICAKKDFSAAGSIYQAVFDGATYYVSGGSFDPEDGTYAMDQNIWETQPHESGTPAWTEAGMNGANYGVRSKVANGDQSLTQLVVEVLRENGDAVVSGDDTAVVIVCG